jgi:hypothetical protein
VLRQVVNLPSLSVNDSLELVTVALQAPLGIGSLATKRFTGLAVLALLELNFLAALDSKAHRTAAVLYCPASRVNNALRKMYELQRIRANDGEGWH